jgi:hypothetical protein
MKLRAKINGSQCVVYYDQTVTAEEAPAAYPYVYSIRHDEDDWTRPIAIEPFVLVNFFGTVCMKTPIDFNLAGFIEIEQFEPEDQLVRFSLSGNLMKKMLRL